MVGRADIDEDAAAAGDWDNIDVHRGIEHQGNIRASEGLAVDLVADLRGELEEGRLVVAPVPGVVDVDEVAGHGG